MRHINLVILIQTRAQWVCSVQRTAIGYRLVIAIVKNVRPVSR